MNEVTLLALSSGKFLTKTLQNLSLKFEKRDIVLAVGVFLFMIGLIPFMAPVYAVIIAVLMYFGLKFYTVKRQQKILNDIGEGICAECGSQIINKACPNCASKN